MKEKYKACRCIKDNYHFKFGSIYFFECYTHDNKIFYNIINAIDSEWCYSSNHLSKAFFDCHYVDIQLNRINKIDHLI